MTYIGLGERTLTATADQTGLNTGNLTAAFTLSVLGMSVAQPELYHAAIVNVPSNTTVQVYKGRRLYSVAQLDTIGDWDPAQPMLLQDGQEVYFCFNSAASVTPAPIVTCSFRFDPAVPGNS